ncbi:MAG: hypothetical protein K2K04_03045 [Clostridia bacterium]|nr:hypothetical protein [Clostridia bacterium]
MSENFRKIKKKYLTVAIVAGCILGVCLGVALTCTLAVVLKTCGVKFHWAIYIPIALVLSAGAVFLFFLILRPDDKRIAKKLDRDFALNQKVQTMVEFANVESDMHTLQREQTDEVLGGVVGKRVDLKWLLKFIFVPVIALAMLLAGIFVPAKKTSGGDKEPVYNITDSHETALKNLIADVEGSSLEPVLKVCVVLELDGLLDMLKKAELAAEMETAVIGAVRSIDKLVADTNSYLKIDEVFAAYEELKPLSTAVKNSVVDYKSKKYASLTLMSRVKDREKDAEERITGVLTSWKADFLSKYAPKNDGDTEGTPLPAEEAAAMLENFADKLKAGLADARLDRFAPDGGQPAILKGAEGDGLYNAYTSLAARLDEHAQSINGNDEMFYSNTDGYLTAYIAGVKTALAAQSYNCMMDDYVRNVLSSIFGIYLGKNDEVAPSPTETEGGGNNGNKEENGGGYGPGIHRYGSDDEILDPDSGESKKYSDPVNPDNEGYTFYHKYYDRAMGYVNDKDNPLPDDVAEYIRQYFIYLNNGMEKTKN